MRRLMSTAKTTLLPANHSLGTKKGLHSNERLDDDQDPELTFPGVALGAGMPYAGLAHTQCPDGSRKQRLRSTSLRVVHCVAVHRGEPLNARWRPQIAIAEIAPKPHG